MNSRERIVGLASLVVLMASISNVANALEYTSFVYCTYDLIFFAYEDGTTIEIYEVDGSDVLDEEGNPVQINYGNPMDKGTFWRLTYPDLLTDKNHVYKVTGSNKFSVLSGDAAVPYSSTGGGASGYYAITPDGLGTANELYTYVSTEYDEWADNQLFIVFAYTDDTTVTVQTADPNGVYSNFIAPFVLDAGEHWATDALDCNYVHIDANEPVSALVCYHLGYNVPGSDGKWVGTQFHTYVSGRRAPDNFEDLGVIAWENGTSVTIINTEDPNETIWQGNLSAGQVHIQTDPNDDIYYSITSNKPVSVSVQPWLKDEMYSFYSLLAPSRTGYGVGQEFLLRTQGDYVVEGILAFINILSHTNDAHIDRYDVLTGEKVESYTLDRGESEMVFSGNGRWQIVTDDGFISVCSGVGGEDAGFQFVIPHSAEFAPPAWGYDYFGLLDLSKSDSYTGSTVSPNDVIEYTISFANSVTNENDPNYIGDVNDVIIIDYLPYEVGFIENPLDPDPNYNENNHTYTWQRDTLSPDDSDSVTLAVKVSKLAEPCSVIENKVIITDEDGNIYNIAKITTPVSCWGGDTIYVDKSANGMITGTDWNSAYLDLNRAIARAEKGCGDEIWIAKGKYYIDPNNAGPYSIPQGIKLYGGFKGDEETMSQRDWKLYHSKIKGANSQNDYAVTITDANEAVVLDGLYIGDAKLAGLYCEDANVTISNCYFGSNDGDGIYGENSILSIDNCLITDNAADGIDLDGTDNTLNLSNNLIHHNDSGVDCLYTTSTIINNWIYYNLTDGISLSSCPTSNKIRNNTVVYNGDYGIIGSGANIYNCIVWGNDNQLYSCSPYNSCIQGGNQNNNNINDDPCFAYPDPNFHNFHLNLNSPCVDTGDSSVVDANGINETDIDGDDRIFGDDVDMGADEVDCNDVSDPYDWNADGVINMHEFAVYSNAWLSSPEDDSWNPNCDRDSNDIIDVADLIVFAEQDWLWQACWYSTDESWMAMSMPDNFEMSSAFSPEQIPYSLMPAPAYEPTIEEQIKQLEDIIEWADDLCTNDEDFQNEINQDDWNNLIDSLENSLEDLQGQ